LKNEAESYIYSTEKLINQDLKDKISQEQGIKITDAVKEVRQVLDKDIDQIKPKLDALKAIVNEITTELYKNVTPPPQEQQTGTSEQTNSENQKNEQTSTSEQDNKNSNSN